MAPKRKASSSSAAVIPPIDPNNQLPFAGNHMSVVSEPDLLHLVSIGVLPPRELCSWRIFHGVTVPKEDTHEFVIYVPFLLRGLALPISPFFRGLLDFYRLNLTHLNPNSIQRTWSSRMVLTLTQPPRVLSGMTRLGWEAQTTAQPPRVLPEMIRLKWVA
jgi:hypothetical protein